MRERSGKDFAFPTLLEVWPESADELSQFMRPAYEGMTGTHEQEDTAPRVIDAAFDEELVGVGHIVQLGLREVRQHIGMTEHGIVQVLHDAGHTEAYGVVDCHGLPHGIGRAKQLAGEALGEHGTVVGGQTTIAVALEQLVVKDMKESGVSTQ